MRCVTLKGDLKPLLLLQAAHLILPALTVKLSCMRTNQQHIDTDLTYIGHVQASAFTPEPWYGMLGYLHEGGLHLGAPKVIDLVRMVISLDLRSWPSQPPSPLTLREPSYGLYHYREHGDAHLGCSSGKIEGGEGLSGRGGFWGQVTHQHHLGGPTQRVLKHLQAQQRLTTCGIHRSAVLSLGVSCMD